MANELPNAVALIQDPSFNAWCMAAGVYQATQVLNEDPATANHALRLRLADDVIVTPSLVTGRLVSIVATDPSICGLGSTVTAIGQTAILNKVAAVWTQLATLTYPNPM